VLYLPEEGGGGWSQECWISVQEVTQSFHDIPKMILARCLSTALLSTSFYSLLFHDIAHAVTRAKAFLVYRRPDAFIFFDNDYSRRL